MTLNEAFNLTEEIRPESKGILVLDIDDTLLSANPDVIKIYKSFNGGKEIPLTTGQFANDPDKGKPGFKFDIRDFRDPQKVYDSIVKGTPKLKNLKLMDAYIRAGYKVCFLTARGLQDTVEKALKNFLRTRDNSGELVELGKIFKTSLSAAVNDEAKKYPGKNDGEKKANVLKNLCSKYNKVVFVDDDPRNIVSARELKIPNLTVVKAN